MKHCAFLTMASLDAFECYDHLLFDPLSEYGWHVEEMPWRNPSVDWNQFEAVIIRSPWDYQEDPDAFMEVLSTIDQSTARLENSLDIVRWNLDKRYLNEMHEHGIPVVKTIWENRWNADGLQSYFDALGEDELIIKPVISANADHTYRVSHRVKSKTLQTLQHVFEDRPLMVQPFMKNIIHEGEFSLFYFAGNYSHAILKTPEHGDFRVQEEHGGCLSRIEPAAELRTIGQQTIQAMPEIPLYARADFVRTSGNNFALMELELIEPSLYFNMDPESPDRFAKEFNQWMQNKT